MVARMGLVWDCSVVKGSELLPPHDLRYWRALD
jgi:hypothetical protein